MSADYHNFGTYIKENHNRKPKDLFVQLAGFLERKRDRLPKNARVLDIGCATGALIQYLKGRFPEWSYTGVDISSDLVNLAKTRVAGAEFHVGSATNILDVTEGKYDLILCFGVLGIFEEDDARKILEDSICLLKNGGISYFLSQFSAYDVDVSIKHRKYKDNSRGEWEGGWSIYSQRTIREWLEKKTSSLIFIDFKPNFHLEPSADPVRTWTIEADGKTCLTNGLNILVNLRYLEISV